MADLNAGTLVARAMDAGGLDDFGDPSWREGFDRLVDSLNAQARLSDLGAEIVAGELIDYLDKRARIIDWAKSRPAIPAADVVPPIVIVGQARTGTTILHDILAQDPATRVPLTWEVDRPVPPPQTATYGSDPRIAEVQATNEMIDLVIPGFRAMHPLGAQLAQECVRMTGAAFRSMIFPTQYRVPSYAAWLLNEADMAPAYRWHRAYLQHLQSEHPARRWVLKSPGHIWCLPALLAEYPDALLVQTHRDPLRIVASVSSLIALLRKVACDDPTIPEVAAEFAEYILDGVDRSVRDRECGVVPPERVVDVQFGSFLTDPFATVHEIYDKLGLELRPDIEAKMRDFLAANPSDKHGTHRYAWADTGLDLGEWRVRARTYQEYFDVPEEEV